MSVGNRELKEKTFPIEMKEKFIGDKGYGLRLLWDATKPDTRWDYPENEIAISSGPIRGITQYSGTGKSPVVRISTQTDSVMDSNAEGFLALSLNLPALVQSKFIENQLKTLLFLLTVSTTLSKYSELYLSILTDICSQNSFRSYRGS